MHCDKRLFPVNDESATLSIFSLDLHLRHDSRTLESVIDVGQGISVGPGKFDKKNKRRALNTHVLCSK